MPKIIDARIAYFMRKYTEWSASFGKSDPNQRERRRDRLIQYQTAMRKQIGKEAPEWITRQYSK